MLPALACAETDHPPLRELGQNVQATRSGRRNAGIFQQAIQCATL
jgi:hypothetical protein